VPSNNLGSHMMGGGVVENFSGNYFCHFCKATRDCLVSGNCSPDNFKKRSPINYDAAVEYIKQNNVDASEGIKGRQCYTGCLNSILVLQAIALVIFH
jgi:hypothetical protein